MDWINTDWINALWGGILIGISASLMLLWSGRVAGISGIIYGLLKPQRGDISWRISFVLGLLGGGVTLALIKPSVFGVTPLKSDWLLGIAGVLVGVGTALGGGCTSGHGVCGISRLSLRSIVATMIFIIVGMLSVVVFKRIGVLP